MADQNTLTFTDTNFDAEVVQSDVLVLVDVWSEGCGGCRQLAPVIDVLASEYQGKAKVGKLSDRVLFYFSSLALICSTANSGSLTSTINSSKRSS